MDQSIKMEFSIDEMNIILQALSKESFKDVYLLIGKINDAASQQLGQSDQDNFENQ